MISNTGSFTASSNSASCAILTCLPIGFSFSQIFFYKRLVHYRQLARSIHFRFRETPAIHELKSCTLPPYGGSSDIGSFPGKTHAGKMEAMFAQEIFPTRQYKIQFVDGRGFTEAEVNGARKLAVVNQTFVKKYLGNENPIGRQVRIAQLAEFDDAVKEPVFEIIGLVADAKNRGLQEPVEPEIWVPYTVTGSAFRGILVRTAREPLTMMNAVEHEIWATDANVAVTLTGTLEGYISQFSFAGPRFGFLLMTIFGAIGLVLVTIGVYSVLAYTTVRRTPRDWDSNGAGSERLGRARIGDSNGAAIGGDWRGPWADRQPGAREGDCDTALGSVGVRPVDAHVRSNAAGHYRAAGMLDSRAARGKCRSTGGAAV